MSNPKAASRITFDPGLITGHESKSSHPKSSTRSTKKSAPIGPCIKSPNSKIATVVIGKIHRGIKCSLVSNGAEIVSSQRLENSMNPRICLELSLMDLRKTSQDCSPLRYEGYRRQYWPSRGLMQ